MKKMNKIEENSILNYLSNIPFVYREKLNVPDDMKFGTEIEFMTGKALDVKKRFIKIMNNQDPSNKKYYIRIRAYKLVDGKKIYGDFSKVKNIKIKQIRCF